MTVLENSATKIKPKLKLSVYIAQLQIKTTQNLACYFLELRQLKDEKFTKTEKPK